MCVVHQRGVTMAATIWPASPSSPVSQAQVVVITSCLSGRPASTLATPAPLLSLHCRQGDAKSVTFQPLSLRLPFIPRMQSGLEHGAPSPRQSGPALLFLFVSYHLPQTPPFFPLRCGSVSGPLFLLPLWPGMFSFRPLYGFPSSCRSPFRYHTMKRPSYAD